MIILDKEKNENSRSYVIRVLSWNIINLELPPGSLVSENDIATRFHVSRTPVREAIIELSKQKLIDVYPQRGSYVSKIDFALIEETRFMRLVLERAILNLICEDGIAEENMIRLQHNVNLERFYLDHAERERLFEMDEEFHRILFEAVDKKRIYDILKAQMVHFDRLRSFTVKNVKELKIVEDHEKILDAIQEKNGHLACDLIECHLTRHQIEKDELIEAHPEYFE